MASKKRKSRRTTVESPAGLRRSPENGAEQDRAARDGQRVAPPSDKLPLAPASPLMRWSLPFFLAFLVLYLVLFFTSPEPALRVAADSDAKPTRIDMAQWLWRVRLPELARVWTDESWSNVELRGRLYVLALASLTLLCGWACGSSLLDLLQIARGLDRVESFVFSLGVGLNVVSLLVLVVGVFGLMSWLPWLTVALIAVLLFGRRLPRLVRSLGRELLSDSAPMSETDTGKRDAYPTGAWLNAGALWLATPFLALMVAGALFPPREFDVREYHLQAPKEWFQAGRIAFLPHNVYASMPLGPQLLALPAMAMMPGERSWWVGAMVGKLLLASYAPLTALALFAAGRRFFSEAAGVIAALVYISLPWIAHVSMEGYVDGALACYLFLAVYAVLLADAATDDDLRRRRLFLAGLLAGAAVCTKYTGALFVVAPLGAWVFAGRLPRVIDARGAAIFSCAVVLACGPWLGKNWMQTGNPVYPLAYNLFGGETRTPEKNAQWQAAHAVPQNDYGERYSPRQMGDAVASVTLRSEWLSPIVWPLAALALFIIRNRRTMLALVAMLAFVLLAWFTFTHRIDRFWIPALPLAALLAGIGATWRDDAWWRRAMFAVLFWGLVWNATIIAGALAPPKMLVAYETLRGDASLAPLAHTYLNEHAAAGRSVLLVGDAEPFDLDMPAYYNTCFDDCIAEQWLKDKPPRQQLAELHRRNVSHLLVNWSEINRYRSPGNYGYSDWPQPEIFHDMVRQGVLKNPQRVSSRTSGQRGELYEVSDAPP